MKALMLVIFAVAAGIVVADEPAPPCKVCACVPKTDNTRKAYCVKDEEYCLPRCSWWRMFCGNCCDGSCGELRVRHRLVIKKVPDCETAQCVPRKP